MRTENTKIKDLPWGAIVVLGIQFVSAIGFVIGINATLKSLEQSTRREFEVTKDKMAALGAQIAVQQNTLDQRGQYGMLNNEKTIKLEGRVDNLEKAIGTINTNIQTIVDRIWDEKKPRIPK